MQKIIRVPVTEAEHRALRVLAAEKMWTMQQLTAHALHESPVTKAALRSAVNGGDKG